MADLLERVTAHWHRRRPDAVVLIDYPGFHWWVAARAKAMGIPVVSFVPPQIWGWASHRVSRMRKNFDHVLCALPFEEPWFRERGVNGRYIGHPYFDELDRQQLDRSFIAQLRSRGHPVVGLLPGSRSNEVRHNFATLAGTARFILNQGCAARFVFPCYKERHADWVRQRLPSCDLPAEVHVGRTPEVIAAADVCVAVSGSVGLELLYHVKPTVVVYRTTPFYRVLVGWCQNVPYISLVNLLAGREVFPEYLLDHDESAATGQHIVQWLTRPAERQRVVAELAALRETVARPGACAAAAAFLAERYGRPARRAA
jgi:lipid-A-disaccharide synthase